MRSGSGLVSLGAILAAAACTFSSEITVRRHQLLEPPPPGLVNAYNLEERLARGFVPEVIEFLQASGGAGVTAARGGRILGQALLERGDFAGARLYLERAFAEEARLSERADTAWLLSQGRYWENDFAGSARWARASREAGRLIPEGWIAFLESAPERLYSGSPAGTRLTAPMVFGRPELIRLAVRINDGPVEQLVVDTGASVSLLTEGAAERFGVPMVPGAVASAYGLHHDEIPLRFGWAKSVHAGGVTLHDVPFGVLSDDAMTFQTAAAGTFRVAGVLGAHLLKEFDWRFEYQGRRVLGLRLEPGAGRGSSGQNLFFRRLKPMVRASLNQEPWFLFLLDTGSEPTMVTRSGLRRSRSAGIESSFPMTLEGIGRSRVSWGKLSNVTVGVDRYMATFKDLVVKEEGEGLEDGIVGSSLLSRFDVELRFGAMTATLERPVDRLLREESAPQPGVPIPVPRGRS